MRKYRVQLQEAHPVVGNGYTAWEIRDVITGPKVSIEVEAASFDQLDAQVQVAFANQTAWEHASVWVRVADGGRKPNGFARRYETGMPLVHRAVAA